ncbi:MULTISPECIES: helix-turn-helix domain-containing protein [Streptomyces]|uniref:helix-turn-helix domain-containing protein n=1 Tax=Streptomyces TaxID=1883 RepID=UPI0022497905|nr:helix-turn-helix domain-containing protein [Streptomyces sp. JHD 1]MCX2969405.1 helix-turn-helix domain-containing protein [Streptomyces sp. JHD 1]
MTLPVTTSAPITPLTPALQRIAQHLADGLTPQEIATKTGLSAMTVRQYLRDIRESLHCPPRCKPLVIVHRLFALQQVAAPTTHKPTPKLSQEQLLLLRAVAEHTSPSDIAREAGLAPADSRAAVDTLLAETGATDTTQLVVLAHTWGLLGADQQAAVSAGARR